MNKPIGMMGNNDGSIAQGIVNKIIRIGDTHIGIGDYGKQEEIIEELTKIAEENCVGITVVSQERYPYPYTPITMTLNPYPRLDTNEIDTGTSPREYGENKKKRKFRKWH